MVFDLLDRLEIEFLLEVFGRCLGIVSVKEWLIP
jgi:hypothetical protein